MMLIRQALLVAVLGVACAIRRGRNQPKDCYSMYDGMSLVRLNATTAAENAEMIKAARELQCTEAWEDLVVEVMAICDVGAVAVLKENFGEKMEVVEEDVGGSQRHSSGTARAFSGMSSDFYADYRDYDAKLGRIQALVEASSGVAILEEVGRSIENRPIYNVRLRGAGYVAGGPRIVVDFQLHAREWIT